MGSHRVAEQRAPARPVGRRFFLRALAVVGGVVLMGDGAVASAFAGRRPPPVLLWSEEFDTPLDLVTNAHPGGRWRTSDVWQPVGEGYADFGAGDHACWMASPTQRIGDRAYNPFQVRDSVLTITATRTPHAALGDVTGCPWLGGMLISNTDRDDMTFGYGYYEFRMRLPASGRGMFPALWLYAAHDRNPHEQHAAEIDLFEVFGDAEGRPWVASIHAPNGHDDDSATETQVVTQDEDSSDWHTYGVDWTAEHIAFYRDRSMLATVGGATARSFAGCRMSIRMDYSMDGTWFASGNQSDANTPDALSIDIDYVRRYDHPY